MNVFDILQLIGGIILAIGYIAKDSSTRTCVFHKGDVPDWSLNEAQKKAVKTADILMIDGNEMTAALEAVKLAKASGTKVLYDAGGLYDGVEKLLPYADILIPSEEFALGYTGAKTVKEAAEGLYKVYSPEIIVVTQGSEGGIIYDGHQIQEYPAFYVEAVDTNGSGDVFHGAFAYAVINGFDYYKACIFSSAVSALKCTKVGARAAVPTLDEANNFLKERGQL